MASSRHIQSPGIELNEIDRSQYGKTDYSLPNALVTLVTGFANKGENYQTNWINTKNTFIEIYGEPTNEPEKYFYNAACEILNRGGVCIASKLPYNNETLNKINYCEFSVSKPKEISEDGRAIVGKYSTLREIRETVYEIEDNIGRSRQILTSIKSIKEEIEELYKLKSLPEPTIQKIIDLKESLEIYIKEYLKYNELQILRMNDNYLTSYSDIKYINSNKDTLENYDNYLINSRSITKNTIRIYDITKKQYGELSQWKECVKYKDEQRGDCLGIIPVITTASNALFFQNLIDFSLPIATSSFTYEQYNPLSGFTSIETHLSDISTNFSDLNKWITQPIASLRDDDISSNGYDQDSLSRTASLRFPTISFENIQEEGIHYSRKYMKQIGVVVFEVYEDKSNQNKMSFKLLESFVGSLDRTAKDDILKNSIFIDDIVNANSNYIRFFSNVEKDIINNTSLFMARQNKPISLGFYHVDCSKIIHRINSIIDGLNVIFEQNKDPNILPVDIIIDAGVSNIAQLISQCGSDNQINFDENPDFKDFDWKFDSNPTTWKQILNKFNTFTKFQRKDCIFLADGLRTFCINGDQKIVRRTNHGSSVEKNILPNLKYMVNVINSSYAAGYCNWFFQQDDYSGDYFWIPPSIKMAGVFIYCSTYFHQWDAPAGMTRGIIPNVVDCAFTPDENDAGKMYNQQWNFAINYPVDGIIAEGQKTFQVDKTALDRINVRMLMLYLEKRVVRIARRFVYEGNTPYLRQRFVDEIRPIFENAVNGYGLKEYAIKCNDELNTTEVIENNEMRCRITIKPIKVVEYILLDFIVTNQSSNVNEEVIK